MGYKLTKAEYFDLLRRLRLRQSLSRDQVEVVQAAVLLAQSKDPDATNTSEWVIEAVKAAYQLVDPSEPRELFVEYLGKCKRRRSYHEWEEKRGYRRRMQRDDPDVVESYASGWVGGGWSVVFPEEVLRAFFGEPEVPFDGNFHKLLLQSKDLRKSYRELARRYHPDLNQGRSKYFLKLKAAYDDLQDPKRRKRYAAGLRFQQLHEAKEKGVVDVVTFVAPQNCGQVVVTGHDTERHLIVDCILSWEPVRDAQGRVLRAIWGAPKMQGVTPADEMQNPFYHIYEFTGDIEFNVTV